MEESIKTIHRCIFWLNFAVMCLALSVILHDLGAIGSPGGMVLREDHNKLARIEQQIQHISTTQPAEVGK